MTGIGVTELLENISALLPANNSSPDEELSGVVLKLNVNLLEKRLLM